MNDDGLHELLCDHAGAGNLDGLREVVSDMDRYGLLPCEFLNRFDNDGYTPLMRAAESGRASCVTYLVWNGANVNAQWWNGRSALMCACAHGHEQCCMRLLKAGARAVRDDDTEDRCCVWADEHDDVCTTPLIVASTHGHLACVRLLLSHYAANHSRARLDNEDSVGHCAITAAADAGHLACVDALLVAGANPDAFGTVDPNLWGHTALMFSAQRGDAAAVRRLADGGARLDAYDAATGETAAHMAVGMAQCMQTLVDCGVPLDMRDYSGKTPLARALDAHDLPSATVLIKAGATVGGNVDEHLTPIGYACSLDDEDLVRKLAKVEDVDARADAHGRTCLALCCCEGRVACARALLECGASACKRDNAGWTPLMHACDVTALRCVRMLLFHGGCDAEARSRCKGWTALTVAAHRVSARDDWARSRRFRCVAALLAARCDPNRGTAKGWTPLHLACRAGCTCVARLLLEAGARTDVCLSKERKSASDVVRIGTRAERPMRALLAAYRKREMAVLMSMR